MGLELIKSEKLSIYNDGRVFDWQDHGYYLVLEDYTVMHRFEDMWEVFYRMEQPDSQRLSTGSKEFCMKSIEHQIRQDEKERLAKACSKSSNTN